jgi:uncharacterized membrane protein YedE/YeeE
MKQNLLAFIAGCLFGSGLCISRMADPEKVLDFLDVTGNWDPSLMLVMGGALTMTLVTFRFILSRDVPLFATCFQLPTKTDLDKKLITGAALFGIGWGMIGYCPGPAITALGFGIMGPFYVVVGMVAGFITYKFILKAEI